MAHDCDILEAHSDEDHWTDLLRELREHNAWGGGGGMSAYVGIDDRGNYYGGVNDAGEWMGIEELAADGKTATETLIDVVRRMRAYRQGIDAERAAWAQEETDGNEDTNA